MTEQRQTLSNNCVQACIASILDVPLEKVPHVIGGNHFKSYHWTNGGWERLVNECGRLGYKLSEINGDDRGQIRDLEKSGVYYVGIGPNGFGGRHAVVMKSGRQVFDPGGGHGIVGPDTYYRLEREADYAALVLLAVMYLVTFWVGDMIHSGHVISVWTDKGLHQVLKDENHFRNHVFRKLGEFIDEKAAE